MCYVGADVTRVCSALLSFQHISPQNHQIPLRVNDRLQLLFVTISVSITLWFDSPCVTEQV